MTIANEPKRLTIKRLIEEGSYTRDAIRKELQLTRSSLATNFNYLRLMGNYPIPNENGILSFTDENGWKEFKLKRSQNSKKKSTKTPQELYDLLIKRIIRCNKSVAHIKGRVKKNPDDSLLKLKQEKAELDLEIAETEKLRLLTEYEVDIDTTPDINTSSDN